MSYEADVFTEADVYRALDARGLRYYDKGRYILSQCPTHEDNHPSVQIYKDDWFVSCLAVCGRTHITKALPEISNEALKGGAVHSGRVNRKQVKKPVVERTYAEFDLMEDWKNMPLIPRDHQFKNLPLTTLDVMGWRWDEYRNSYFIPYFNRSQTRIPFAQYRRLSGDVRFTFLKDAKPTMYGTWNLLENMGKIFLVEGSSDAAVLETCGIPWISAPSASSGALVKAMAGWCSSHGVKLVYAGDNDLAGDKLLASLNEANVPYRVKQPRQPYKDWGDMYEAEGYDSVRNYLMAEYESGWTPPIENWNDLDDEEKILKMFPGATVMKVRK